MKIIGYNKIKTKKEKYYKFTCKNCGCIYVISSKDEMWYHDFWGRHFPICPNCKEETITWFTFNHRVRNLNNKCDGYVWEYKETMKDWYSSKNQCYMFSEYFKESLKNCLWHEVEIIVDKPKKIDDFVTECTCSELDFQMIDYLDEIRKAVNYLLEKSDKE